MPFENERANKGSHVDLINNPDVSSFLADSEIITVPTDEEAKAFASQFLEPPAYQKIALPDAVVAIDGSLYESQIYKNALPSTRVGYVKIVTLLIKTAEFEGIRDQTTGLVDPFLLAKLRDSSDSLAVALPGSNVRYQGRKTVREGFRAALEESFKSEKTWIDKDSRRSLLSTLFAVAGARSSQTGLYTGDTSRLRLHKCPNCGVDGTTSKPIEVQNNNKDQSCPNCGEQIFATDCLRIWEAVSEGAPIGEALGRTMSVIEHILPLHYARNLAESALEAVAGLAFFVDGPLAVFGNAAWIHSGILRLYNEINERLSKAKLEPMCMIGLQKTGAVREHVDLIDRFIGRNRVFPINDDYRYKYISPRTMSLAKQNDDIGFGLETYYGQDFVFKTPSSKTFVIGIPYPFRSKSEARDRVGKPFKEAKTDMDLYPTLAKALRIIQYFESDLYTNASIPIALAHQHTAISLVPGGKVLDLLTHRGLRK